MNSEEHVGIEGTLLMLDDATPHVAVPVQAIRDGQVIATTLSDESGRYQFIDLKPGTYQVRCYTLDGYFYYAKEKLVERAELERVHQELEDARRIQQSLLPERSPEVRGFEVAGTSLPAREVSGDFYDYLSLGKDVGVVLADVTGKSVKAAMVAAMTDGMLHSEVKEHSDMWTSPGGILAELNMGLKPRLIRGMFTAMSLGVIRAHDSKLLFSNAGMPYPIVKRGDEVWELKVNGLPLGITDAAEYNDLRADLEDGDFIIFYSDGVIEAENETAEMYQTERLLEVVQEASSALSAQEMVDLIVSDVTAFVGDVEPSDDITVVATKIQ